jgi:AcrR family transcriptional regulator
VRPEPTTAERLLAGAADLFGTQGYAGTSMREVAEAAGIRKPSLYHHISGKEELLFDICVESLRRLEAAVEDALAVSPEEERLVAVVRAHVVTSLADQSLHVVMLAEMRALSDARRAEVIARRDAYQRLIADVVLADVAAGRLRSDIDARYLALMLLNLVNWTIVWFRPDGGIRPQELGELLARLYLEGAQP